MDLEDVDFDTMEEPVPCRDCGEWVELQETRACKECDSLVCRVCLDGQGRCKYCREEP